jgi:hypothetical protein
MVTNAVKALDEDRASTAQERYLLRNFRHLCEERRELLVDTADALVRHQPIPANLMPGGA